MGDPPALPGRLPEFDNSGNMSGHMNMGLSGWSGGSEQPVAANAGASHRVQGGFRYCGELACAEDPPEARSTQRERVPDQRPNGLSGFEPLHLRQASGFAGGR